MRKVDQRCGNCYYGKLGAEIVCCQRFPPLVTKVEGENVTSTFPLLRIDGWCGEWRKDETKLRIAS